MDKGWEKTMFYAPQTGLMADWSGMDLNEAFLDSMRQKISDALTGLKELEAGAVANPDEGRMVGHYWLRAPQLAPTPALRKEIEDCVEKVRRFAADVHSGKIRTERGDVFRHALVGGIGGSSLGPMFVADALGAADDPMDLYFLDNTDPAGMDKIFAALKPDLDAVLTVIISKSGGTIETRNCMAEAKAFYEANGLDFAKHAVCVTGAGSKLDAAAESEGWLDRFPMWDWVGGRTSVMSAVGLLPLALKGIDIDSFLAGAADCDRLGRAENIAENPALLLALSWYRCSEGRGGVTQVVLPYKDSLMLFAKYLQQLLMESLGKEYDLAGNPVHQGLAVMGNKGTSDQHSYVQQLVGGPDNIFVTFIQVLKDRGGASMTVGEGSTSGDYLNAFMLGTKKALEDHGKRTFILTVPEVNAYHVGQLIAVFERAVGMYAVMIGINAYHQPAVEFGKKAAGGLIDLKSRAAELLLASERQMTAQEIAAELGAPADDVFRLMIHLCSNDPRLAATWKHPLAESVFGKR
ncbi:MAG: glucose-6-phosphate isomerase [Firmicutes bacterium]|nr:glucose-6-phosphate isomerase [Bacillota bacterium]